MRILIVWGSKRGGTEGIARSLAEALAESGHAVTVCPAHGVEARDVDAVIVGGALYANRWHRAARRFVTRNEDFLRTVPTWLFSSGPLDDSATQQVIAPTPQVATLMERIGATGHATFGGRLAPDARGFPASAMAKKHAGDWRDPAAIRAWALEIARALPFAKPAAPVPQPGRSIARLVAHGVVGWAACAAVMAGLLAIAPATVALVAHALLAPMIFAIVARLYFRARGAREPVATALVFAAIVATLDLVIVAGAARRGLALVHSVVGFWLPLVAIFAVTAVVGMIASIGPIPKRQTKLTA